MRVLLIGAGRYGNGLIGKKYARGELGTKLTGVVDPKIDEIKKTAEYALKGYPTYHSLSEVPRSIVQSCVNEVAIIPQIIPEVYKQLAEFGAKKIILPKPIVTNEADFNDIIELTNEEKIKALVASNWHYSNITKLLKALLQKLTDGETNESSTLPLDFQNFLNRVDSGYKITKVDIDYNKKNEVLTIDPPLQELPHAMQIVYTSGITNLEKIKLVLKQCLQSRSCVNANIIDNNLPKTSITLNTDLQMKERLNKRRERLAKIYLEKDGESALVTADYDADFYQNGTCIKRPSISFESPGLKMKFDISEDNMNVMYKSMFKYLQGEENNSLTLEKYKPIAKRIFQIEELWKQATR